jgi:cytochrome c oxidase subunit II
VTKGDRDRMDVRSGRKVLERLPKFAALAGIVNLIQTPLALASQPEPWGLNLQEAASPIMEQMIDFHDLLLVIITGITLFVTGLLIWAIIRYNRRANPEPAKFHHNTTLEVLWTVVPILILVIIAIPSFRLLYAQHSYPQPDLTIKATGYQWYWEYEYPDAGFSFGSFMIEDADLEPGQPRLLAVDADVVVPVGKTVQVLVTAADVMHNWTVPAFGSKIDAIPGRVNRTWFQATQTGTFYGQCSELCGARHAFMPIAVRVVTQEEYDAWLESAKQEFAAKGRLDETLLATGEPLNAASDTQIAVVNE